MNDMKRDERVRRYEANESIYSIAKLAEVSKQAVMASLMRAGVYTPGDRMPKPKSDVEVKDYSVPTYDVNVQKEGVSTLREQEEVLNSADEGICNVLTGVVREEDFDGVERRLYANVFITPKGCKVFDRNCGGWVTYSTFADLLAIYG